MCVVQERRELQLALIPSVGSALSLASFSHTEVPGCWSFSQVVSVQGAVRWKRHEHSLVSAVPAVRNI